MEGDSHSCIYFRLTHRHPDLSASPSSLFDIFRPIVDANSSSNAGVTRFTKEAQRSQREVQIRCVHLWIRRGRSDLHFKICSQLKLVIDSNQHGRQRR